MCWALFSDRATAWANRIIDEQGEAGLTSFIASPWFPVIPFAFFTLVWLVAFLIFWERSNPSQMTPKIPLPPRLVTERQDTPDIQTQRISRDAVNHATVEGQRLLNLRVKTDFNPWRILYPLVVENRRGVWIEITGFDVDISWNGNPIQKVQWQEGDSTASNAMPMGEDNKPRQSFRIDGDHRYTLEVPINGKQVGSFPATSPKWTNHGRVSVRATDQTNDVWFHLNDDYRMTDNDWDTWVNQH